MKELNILKEEAKILGVTNEELEDICKEYDQGEKTIKNIIKMHNIKNPVVNELNLVTFLPPVIATCYVPEKNMHRILNCPYCDVEMYRRRKNRKELEHKAKCIICEHEIFYKTKDNLSKDISDTCYCNNCRDTRKKIYEEKRRKIKDYYSESHNKLEWRDISTKNKVKLINLIKQEGQTATYLKAKQMDLNADDRGDIIELSKEGIISVSSSSDIDAFTEEDFPRVSYVAKAEYDININWHLFELDIIEYENYHLFFIEEDSERVKRIISNCLYKDTIQALNYYLTKRGLPEYIEKETDNYDIRTKLINNYSYDAINCYCLRVAKWISDKYSSKELPYNFSETNALNLVIQFIEKAVDNGWSTKPYDNWISSCGLYTTNVISILLGVDSEVIIRQPLKTEIIEEIITRNKYFNELLSTS